MKYIFFSIILSIILSTTIQLRTTINIKENNFCLYKKIFEGNKFFYIKTNVKQEIEETFINIYVDMERENENTNTYENIKAISQIKDHEEQISLNNPGMYRVCFVPISEGEVSIEYEIHTEVEQLKLKKLADKKSFEEVKTDLVNLKETSGKLDSKIKEIFTKRYKHYLGKITLYYINNSN